MSAPVGKKRRKHKKLNAPAPTPDINVTPLVDIVLVLLIIFMVVTPALAQGEATQLPVAAKIDKVPKDVDPIKLIMAANGVLLAVPRSVTSCFPVTPCG